MHPIPYAVIGVGRAGRLHAKLAHELPDFDLVAVVDPNREMADRISAEFGCEALYDVSELDLRGIGAVSIAVPSVRHFDVGLTCIQNGWHVMMEKPLAMTTGDARRLVRAADDGKVVLAVGHQYRLHTWAQKVKRLLDDEVIGEPLQVVWTLSDYRSDRYFVERPWKAGTEYPISGILANQAAHTLDQLLWMFGEPVEVTAHFDRRLHGSGGDDVMMALIRFESGCLANVTWSINVPRGCSERLFIGTRGMIRMPNVRSVTFDVDDEIRIGRFDADVAHGVKHLGAFDQPTLVWDESERDRFIRLVRRRVRNGLGIRRRKIDQSAPHRTLLARFASAIRGEGKPMVTGEDGARVVELMESIAAAATRTREKVL